MTATATPTSTVSIPAGVRINEILPVPGTVDWNGDGVVNVQDQWIELYNAGSTTADLGGWSITRISEAEQESGSGRQTAQEGQYTLPAGTMLPPGAFLVVYGSQSGLVLDTAGGQVRLLDSQEQEVDRVVYGVLAPDVSLNRAEDGTWYTSLQPTPGAANTPALATTRATRRRVGRPAGRGR